MPYQKVQDLHLWQLCHLVMVAPIADAYYKSDCPGTYKDFADIRSQPEGWKIG